MNVQAMTFTTYFQRCLAPHLCFLRELPVKRLTSRASSLLLCCLCLSTVRTLAAHKYPLLRRNFSPQMRRAGKWSSPPAMF